MKALLFGSLSCLLIFATVALSRSPHDRTADSETSPAGIGEIETHVIGRLVADSSGTAQLIGYYPYIAGIQGNVFSGAPSEATAYFTLRSTPFTVQLVPNGDLVHLFSTPANGLTGYVDSVFFNANPNQSFQDPDSFSRGQLIARYGNVHFMGTVAGSSGTEAGSLELLSSADFTFQGKTYNVEKFSHALTISLTFGAPLSGAFTGGPLVVPFGGYAISAEKSKTREDDEDR